MIYQGKMPLHKVVFLFFFLVSTLTIRAAERMFTHLEAQHGLSNSQINCIFKDSRGFMWFGTSSGLNRYDGYRMQVYRNRPDNLLSLPDSYIHDICEDHNGLMWVRTSVGYAIYNPRTDNFEREVRQHVFQYGLDAEPTLVYVDHLGNYWFYVQGRGCYWYNISQKILYPFMQGEKNGMLPLGDISYMTECSEGLLVVYNTGLMACLNGDMRRIVWMNDYIPSSAPVVKNNYKAFVDKNENVWVYGTPGVRIFNKSQNKWIASLPAFAEQWGLTADARVADAVVGVGQDANGTIWVATRHYGVLLIEPRNRAFKWCQSDSKEKRSLLHNSLRTLYITPERDMVWIGTAKSGIAYYSESAYKFHTDIKTDVTAIAPNGEGYWLGTTMNGILAYNPKTGVLNPLEADIQFKNHEIFALLSARDGSLWAATNKGLFFRIEDKKTTEYRIISNDGSQQPVNYVITSLFEDDLGKIWVATLGAGLQCLDTRTGKITTYSKERDKLPSNKVNSIAMTKKRELLLGTPNGVAVLNPTKNAITSYTGSKGGNSSFTSLYVNQVIEDSRGLWWIATRDGINIYDEVNDRLTVLGAAEGFRNAVVTAVSCSGPQMVWATTAGGIANIVVDMNETGSEYIYRIYNYTEQDGLQGYEFNQRSMWVQTSGEVAVGGIHGLNVFHPNQIIYNKRLPKVIFSELYLGDKRIDVGQEMEKQVILKSAINEGRLVELVSSKEPLTIMFGSDDYTNPAKTLFKYKLEGYTPDWLNCSPLQNGVTFTNLPTGKYQLKVKAINSDGYSNNEASQLTIVVKGTFWTSVWAYLIYIVLFVLLLWILLRIWTKRERKRLVEELKYQPASLETQQTPLESETEEEIEEEEVALPPLAVVVERSSEFRNYIVDCLGVAYRTIVADEAEMGWERILLQQPDVVLLSVDSTESDVYDLRRRIKGDKRTENIPVLLLVARQMKYMQSEDDDTILTKPFTKDQLRKQLQSLLEADDVETHSLTDEDEEALLQSQATLTSEDESFLTNATAYVEQNLSRPELSVEEMATHMGMSRAHFYKRMMAVSGKTPVEFIRSIRLQHATELLKDPRYNVSEVAYQVGFNNPRYFTKYFTDAYGILPSVFRDLHQKGNLASW